MKNKLESRILGYRKITNTTFGFKNLSQYDGVFLLFMLVNRNAFEIGANWLRRTFLWNAYLQARIGRLGMRMG